jgi:glycosyltransferase involved in cell wall biosynthesis
MKVFRISTVPLSLDILLKGQLRFLNNYFEVTAVSGDDSHLRTVEKREGVPVFPLEMQRSVSPLKDIVSLWKLYRLFKRERPFVIHSITPKAGLLSMVAGKLAGVPVRMHTFTGLIFPSRTGLLQKILIGMDRLLCHCATQVYPEGEGVKSDLMRYKITKKPLRIIANGNVNGIDTAFFDKRLFSDEFCNDQKTTLHIQPDDFVFIFVGRLVTEKGISELVGAFDLLSKELPKVKLLLVGPLESELSPLSDDIIKILQDNKLIIQTGFQKDVRPYFAIADALAFPSYREGFPNAVLQAGAMGLSSVVTDINGSNEIVEDEVNGLIIPVKDEKALYIAMKQLADDPELNGRLRSNARKKIVAKYEQKIVWEAILEEYRKFENEHQTHVQ